MRSLPKKGKPSKQQISRAAVCNISLSSPFRRPFPPAPSQDLVVLLSVSEGKKRREREEKPSDVRASLGTIPISHSILSLCLVSVVSLPASSSYLAHGEKAAGTQGGYRSSKQKMVRFFYSFLPTMTGNEAEEPVLAIRPRRVRVRVCGMLSLFGVGGWRDRSRDRGLSS